MNKTTKHPYLLNVRGKLYARATYQLPNGQTVEKRRRINNPKDAARVAGEFGLFAFYPVTVTGTEKR